MGTLSVGAERVSERRRRWVRGAVLAHGAPESTRNGPLLFPTFDGPRRPDPKDRDVIRLVVLDVNETLFPLDPIAERMSDVGLDGQLDVWFTRVLRDGIAAAAAGCFASFAGLARHHLLAMLPAAADASAEATVAHVLGGFDHVRPHPDVRAGLEALRHANVAAAALTNGSAEVTRRFLARADLTELIAAVHDVTDVGRWKPHPEPYRAVLERHDVAPGDAAMVAVHPWDLLGARSAGLRTAWLDRDASRYPTEFDAPDVQATDLSALVEQLVTRRW
jgi:2-haloacid dehalogenase